MSDSQTNRRHTKQASFTLLIGLLALVVPPGCSTGERETSGATATSQPEAAVVETATVKTKEIERTIRVAATLAPSHTLQVTPEVGGIVEEIYADRGTSVEKGAPLARISSLDYSLQVDSARNQLEAAQAGLQQAKAQFETAKKNYQRFKNLYEQDVVPKSRLEEVQTAYEQAKAGYESAKAQAQRASVGIEQAKTRVEDTVIRAPFDGHVVRRMLDEGAVVRPMASPIMVLIDDDPIRAESSVSELHISKINEGMAAEVRVDAFPKRTFSGELTMVNRQVDARTREAAIRVKLPNKKGILRAGMTGTVALDVGSSRQLVVPRTALFERDGKEATVYVVESGTAERRNIQIQPGFETEYPVTKGLSADETVVTWGGNQLRDGLEVTIKQDTSGPADNTSADEDSASETNDEGGSQ